mmetsp:Transcript_35173/g.41965  ORF Transcript_35173/g.41965 Transcript_35173/m.41965 type:complete len:404 (-) Transcript_35173:151-1362(-)
MNMISMISVMRKYRPKKIVSLLLLISALCASFLNYNPLRQLDSNSISSSREIVPLDFTIKRKLVTNLGGGQCEWVDGVDVDQDPNFELFSTAIVAFPGAGKRIAFLQLEALTELTTRDDFFPPSNITRYAYFKTQYPHHEGIWSWGNKCSQSVYLLTNPRMALITYLFILHEIHYAKDWKSAYSHLGRVFTIRTPIEEWEIWRHERVNAEIHWWGWHIDFWMEGGLLRDIFTHELTTLEHFRRLMDPSIYTEAELRVYQSQLTDVQPVYDIHCKGKYNDIPDCRPTAIASYERMMDPSTGPQEVAKFTSVIEGKAGIKFVEKAVRQCAWEKVVIDRGSGRRDTRDRKGPPLRDYAFTLEQETSMMGELVRIRDKYRAPEWSSIPVAVDLVEYMEEYIASLKWT